MAQIPQYSPEKLASSAVGTPGIDTSGQQIGESVAGALEKVAEVRYQRQKIADTITADSASNDYALKFQEARNAIHKKYYGTSATPEQELDEISKAGKDLQGQYLKSMNTVGQKNAFATQSMEVIKSQQQAGYTQALARQTQQVHQDSLNSLNAISSQHSDIWADPTTTEAQKYDQMTSLLNQGQRTLALAQKYLPADEFGKLRDNFAKSFAKAAIFGAIQSNPEQAKKLIDDRVFENHLTIQEQASLSKYADAAVERKNEEAKLNLAYSSNEATQTLWQGIHQGTTRMQDIENAYSNGNIQSPERKALSDLLFSKKIIDTTEKTEVYNKLVEEQNKLFQGKDLTKEATLSSVALLRQHVMEAERTGAITTAKARTFYKATTPVIDDKAMEEMKQSVLNRKSGFDFFGHWVGSYKIGTQEEQSAAKANLTHELAKQIDDAESLGQKLTPTDVKGMAQTILKNYITQQYPQTMNAKDVPNSVITATGGPQQLHALPTASQGAQKVKQEIPVPQYDPQTQILLKNKTTGQYKVVNK